MGEYNPYRMFVGAFVPNWLMERQEISPGAKLCFARLAQYAGKNGRAFPAQETLAAALGVTVRQVQRYIAELIKAGLIETRQERKGTPNHYVFLEHEWMKQDTRQIRRMRATDTSSGGDGYVVWQTSDMSPAIIEENQLRESERDLFMSMSEENQAEARARFLEESSHFVRRRHRDRSLEELAASPTFISWLQRQQKRKAA